ncbi:MAG TPA: hypothetical protein VK256_09220 [Candidatus Eisenbacteria bacterium]|nr:hypothetical protein [Candidatus Eisenbacteria bacterium]
MPTLDDLGRAVAKRLLAHTKYVGMFSHRALSLLQAGRIPTGNVEMWLSSLAEPQPFESRSDVLRNQSLFEDISQILVEIVKEVENDFWSTAPAWAHRLLRLWHRRQATVASFNYDTIVERSMLNLDAPGTDGDIVGAMLNQIPRRAVQLQFGQSPTRTFRLLKLHGSVDWFWNPDDRSGDSLCRVTPDATEHDLRAALAGKVSFIVPPLATKAPFYSLGVVRQLWEEAAHAVSVARRIVVIGYSVPLTDLATTAMLSDLMSPDTAWVIVNPDGSAVRERLMKLGVRDDLIQVVPSLQNWVDSYEREHCGEMSRALIAGLDTFRSTHSERAPIMVRRSRGDYGTIVSRIEHEGSRVVLHAHERQPQTIIPADYPHEPDLVAMLRQLDPPGPVCVRFDGTGGNYFVLGALDPVPLRGTGAVPYWCPIEIQDQPSDVT